MTTISISEKTYTATDVCPALRREEKIIIHDGWQWHMGKIHNEKQLKDFLKFFEMELTTIELETENSTTGKIVYYNLSKEINRSSFNLFWSIEQLKEITNNEPLKKFKGLSNGSIVDCYALINENKVIIYMPNPNAKEVYNEMELKDEIKFRQNNWYM